MTPTDRAGGINLTLTVRMRSDWHCGTGVGVPGGVDKVISLDGRGLPFVPAKTLTGVLRDSCEIAATGLDDPDADTEAPGADIAETAGVGSWHQWVEWLFGSQPDLTAGSRAPALDAPRPAALSIRPALFPEPLADALAARPAAREATMFVRPGVAIDRRTGRAADRLLRFEQMARTDAVLTATASVAGWTALTNDQRAAVCALLGIGAGLVERVGGKRRRGAGECTLTIDGVTGLLASPDWWDDDRTIADWLRARDGQAPPQPGAVREAPERPGRNTDTAAGWDVVRLRMQLATPLLVADRVVGNAVRGMSFVPGTLLLGAVTSRLADTMPDVGSLARRGDLVVTDATIDVGGVAGRPLPRTWMHPKGDESTAANLLVTPPGGDRVAATERYDGYFVGATPADASGRVGVRRPECSLRSHNAIDDAKQRPVSEIVGLFTYEALVEGTVLRAEVRVRRGLLPRGAAEALSGVWRVGRSAKDGYGQVEVTADEPVPLLPPASRAATGTGTGGGGEVRLRVWLLSDLLLRDGRLRPATDIRTVADELSRRLGVKVSPLLTPMDEPGRELAGVAVVNRRESWHRRWQRPRASLVGLAAGSVLTFQVDRAPSPDQLAEAAASGIGERTAEGFGQIAVDDFLLILEPVGIDDLDDELDHDAGGGTGSAPDLPIVTEADGDETLEMARMIEREAWRAHVKRASGALASQPAGRERVLGRGHESIPATQLARLQDALSRLGRDDEVHKWIKRLAEGSAQFADGSTKGWPGPVRDQLEQLLTNRATVWELVDLGPSVPTDDIVLTADGADIRRADQQLWAESVRTVVTTCLRAVRRSERPTADREHREPPAGAGIQNGGRT